MLPLYARLSAAEQAGIFDRPAGRKMIVATNIAETSITMPGIRYVVDTGLARISQYSPRTRTTALPVVSVSRSSADQRKGRCGRVQNGVCIRLFSEADYNDRPLYTPPEILRSNLAEVILRMIDLNLGHPADFPFIDPPSPRHIRDGFQMLVELGAVLPAAESSRKRGKSRMALSERGRIMARMPLDPRLSRILLEARDRGCLPEATVIVAALSIADPRERPVDKTDAADRMHALFHDPASDFKALLNMWNQYQGVWERERSAGVKRFCKSHFLSFKRMREWRDIVLQIREVLPECGLDESEKRSAMGRSIASVDGSFADASLHQSVLSGFLSNIAVRKEGLIYRAARNRQAMIFPGSGLFKSAGTWIVSAEMVETSRLFARTVATVDPSWIEAVGSHQCVKTYLHPRWDANRGEVVADEQVSLYGLILSSDRTVSFGRIDPEQASAIFIQEALIAGNLKMRFPFLEHNLKLVDSIRDMENRLRRRDLLAGDKAQAAFYASRIPKVCDIRSLERRIRENGDRFLCMSQEDLLGQKPR